MVGELRLSGAAQCGRRLDDLWVQTQPAGDFQRQTPAGGPVDQLVGWRECLRVEAERRAGDTLSCGAIGLDHVVVCRRNDVSAPLLEVFHDRPSQRSPFDRVRARTNLVEQDQRRQRELPVHPDDVRDVPRERAQVGGDRLFVADVGKHRSEYRYAGPRRHRDMETSLRH